MVVVLGELADDARRLLSLVERRCVGEDPLRLDADGDALAEAVARLPGNAPLAQAVKRAVQRIVVLDIELDAPVGGHGQSVPHRDRCGAP